MLSAQELKAYAKTLSIPASGVCDAEKDGVLLAYLQKRRQGFSMSQFEEADLEKRCNPKLLMPEAQSVFVCLFPYFREDLEPANISRYAAVTDYHQVVRAYLDKIADFVRERVPDARCLPLCDTSPLSDRHLAYKAGLGFFGKNNLLIHPVFGSWVFIGSLLLSVPLEADKPMETTCGDCGACLAACPGGALSENFGYDCEKCISYITQKKEISEAQKELLMAQESVYGCDVCQLVCPHNQGVKNSAVAEFCQGAILGLDAEALAQMSGRAFKRQYENYAFSWCSKQTILKNFG